MYDLNGLTLDSLLDAASRADLIDAFRLTEWIVILEIGSNELVMNHANAHVFLQGLLHGSARRRTIAEDRTGQPRRFDGYYLPSQRSVIG